MYDNVVIGYTIPVVVREEEAGNLWPDRPADPAAVGSARRYRHPFVCDGLRQEIPDTRIDIIPGCVQGAGDLEQSAGGDAVDPVLREYWQRDAVAATLYSRRVSAPGDE